MPETSHDLRPLDRREAANLATTEYQRFLELIRELAPADWARPTDCPAWDVRALVGHVLGMAEFASSIREFIHVVRAGRKAAGDRPAIDGMTQVQVAERADLSTEELIERMARVTPRAARARGRLPWILRQIRIPEEVDGVAETWRLGYLFDVILTRDTWMHRVDVARAAGRELTLSADHDGRLVADVVAEWARRHGLPYHLRLTGPAGGDFTDASASGGAEPAEIVIDAVEFCRILSGRGTGTGLLAQSVPF